MPIEINIPPLGWSSDDGVFAGWLKRDGDEVKPGDGLFSLEGEKATQDIESFDGGILRIPPTGPKTGDRVKVGFVIGYLVKPGEHAPFEAASPAQEVNGAAESSAREPSRSHASPAVRRLARALEVDIRKINGSGEAGSITREDVLRSRQEATAAVAVHAQANPQAPLFAPQPASVKNGHGGVASPRARRVAKELGVDWHRLPGTGRAGRVRERDVRSAKISPPAKAVVAQQPSESQKLAISSMRRTIAARMLESSQTTAPVTLNTTVDVTNLVNLRNQFKEISTIEGTLVPSYTDFLAKLVAVALGHHPQLNAQWNGDHIEIMPAVNMGIAVDTEGGLLVPVVQNVPGLRLQEVAARTRELVERARTRKLSADEMQGGTFTLTNLGNFGIDTFTPIINYPQCAILGIGRIRREPVVQDNQVAIRDVTSLSLTFDHRIVDGAPAARFLQMVGELIKNPAPCLTL